MKHLKTIIRILSALSLTLLISCGEKSSKVAPYGPKTSLEKKEIRYNDEGEAVIDLDPVGGTKWSDPELQRIEDEIKSSREARVKTKLKSLKDEKIEFSTPSLTLKKDGKKQIDMDVTFQGNTESISFLSPEKHDKDFYFEQTAGFKERKVTLQGMCMDEEEDSCQVLAIQIAYVVNRLKVTEQFILNLTPIEVEEEKTDETSEEIVEEEEPASEEDEDEPVKLEPVSLTTDESAKLDESVEEETFNLDAKTDNLATPFLETEDKTENKETESFNLLKPTPLTPSTEDSSKVETLKEAEKNYEIIIKDDVIDVEYNLEDTSIQETTEETLKNIPIPTQNPRKTLSHNKNEAALVVGSGQVIFPDIEDKDEPKEKPAVVDTEFNVNSAETQEITKVPNKRPKNKSLLSTLRTKKYNQARGYYAAHKTKARGWIHRASHLGTRIKGVVANPYRKKTQHASGLLISSIKYSAEEFNKTYPNSPICINNLSLKKGGRIGKHRSHRNGLDADISYPSTANQCKGNKFFPGWRSLARNDKKFMEKNWHLIKLLVSTNRVHGIFTQDKFVNALCTYVKKHTKTSKVERKKIFKKLHHVNGHWHHYHVRMKCNKQNPGCVTQGVLTGSTCN